MRSARLEPPRISKRLLQGFSAYTAWYLKRNFHAVRASGFPLPEIEPSMPVIVCANHPSWWDPLIACTLASRAFPERSHYAPIDAAALAKYPFFERLGFFGVEADSFGGSSRFLRISTNILQRPDTALWVTAQGAFVDPRVRPVRLKTGVGHLIRRLPRATVLPLAFEYPFWEERYPEALVRFGRPVEIDDGRARSAAAWTELLVDALTSTQDELAQSSVTRNRNAFSVLIGGNSGIGGVYDLWRAVKSWADGKRFHRAHGGERL